MLPALQMLMCMCTKKTQTYAQMRETLFITSPKMSALQKLSEYDYVAPSVKIGENFRSLMGKKESML